MTLTTTRPTFAGLPAGSLDRLDGSRVVILGAPEATAYVAGDPSHAARGPTALREASMLFARQLNQLDFDLGATLLPDKDDRRGLLDIGDVPTSVTDAAGNRERITDAVKTVLDAGAAPILLGGDDSVPIPFLRAFERHGPVCVVQVDAHVDWGDVIRGEPNGYGSPMRRAAELPWVTHMVQLGIRGLGSGEAWQITDAERWGSRIFTSYALHEPGGWAEAIAAVPEGAKVVVSIDCDGIDPAVFPAVEMPTPGGLGYEELVRMLRGVAGRGRLAGLFLGEYVPERDTPHRLSGLTAARLVAVAAGLMLG